MLPTSYKSNKRFNFALRSFWLFSAKVIPTITFIVITVLYSRELSLTEYGIYQSVWMYVNVIAVILNFGAYQMILSTSFKSVIDFLITHTKKVFIFYLVLLTCIALFFFSSSNLSVSIQFILVIFILLQITTLFLEAVLVNNKKGITCFLGKHILFNFIFDLASLCVAIPF